MQVKLTFKEAFELIQEASAQNPQFYGAKYVRFILSKMTLCEDGILLELPAVNHWPDADKMQ